MAVTATPIFTQTPKSTVVTLTTANTDQTGATTTNIVNLITAGANGARVQEVRVNIPQTSQAGLVNIFVSVGGGTTWKLFDTIAITAVTLSATAAGFQFIKTYDNFILTAGATVGASITVATANNPTHVMAYYGDY